MMYAPALNKVGRRSSMRQVLLAAVLGISCAAPASEGQDPDRPDPCHGERVASGRALRAARATPIAEAPSGTPVGLRPVRTARSLPLSQLQKLPVVPEKP